MEDEESVKAIGCCEDYRRGDYEGLKDKDVSDKITIVTTAKISLTIW